MPAKEQNPGLHSESEIDRFRPSARSSSLGCRRCTLHPHTFGSEEAFAPSPEVPLGPPGPVPAPESDGEAIQPRRSFFDAADVGVSLDHWLWAELKLASLP